MSSAIRGQLADLTERCDQLEVDLFDRLAEARDNGREDLTPSENRAFAELSALRERRDELRAEVERAGTGTLSDLAQRVQRSEKNMNGQINATRLVYRKNDQRTSYLQDMVRVALNQDDDYSSRNRLAAHSEQVQTDPAFKEFRDLSRVDGQGGYAVPPLWAIDEYVELARPGRPFANLCMSKPLPGGTDSINIPKVLSGTSTAIQTADNATIEDVDLTDTFINAPVRTISGQQGVAIQLIDQSPIAFDSVVFGDLMADLATKVDLQVMHGTGSAGQVLGIDFTPGINTIAVSQLNIQGVYSAIANAIQTMHSTRFAPPTALVMHPRRWGWLQSLLDTTDRPLFLPYANLPMNAAGVMTDVASQGVVGSVQGIPIVVDASVTTTAGSGSGGGTEDVIYLVRANDLLLWESTPRMRVTPETKAQNLTVLLQAWNYLAFSAQRYPASVCVITGLTAPSW